MRLKSQLASALVLFAVSGGASAESLAKRVDRLYQAVEADVIDAPAVAAYALKQDQRARIWVDVRSAKERKVSAIPGAILLAELPAALKAKKRDVVVYCTVGYRSGLAVLELKKQGIAARNLRGGILAWLAVGGAIVDPAGKPTQKVHVYGKAWAVVPEGFEAIY
jgi:rhodanese-related sulfurtransferase